MYKYLSRNGQLLAFGFGILVSAIFLIPVFSGLDAFSALAPDEKGTTGIFSPGLALALILIVVGFVLMLLFGLYQVGTDVKGSMKGIIGFVAMIVVFFIGRGMGSDNEPLKDTMATFKIDDWTSGVIDGGIRVVFVMILLAAVAFVFSEIRNFFK